MFWQKENVEAARRGLPLRLASDGAVRYSEISALTLGSQKTVIRRYAWNSEGLEMAACASFQAPSPLPRNAMLTGRAKIARTPRHGGGGDGTCTACPLEKGPCSHVWHLQWRATQSLIRESTKIVSFFYPLLHITKPAFYSLSSLQKGVLFPKDHRTRLHLPCLPRSGLDGPGWAVADTKESLACD